MLCTLLIINTSFNIIVIEIYSLPTLVAMVTKFWDSASNNEIINKTAATVANNK